jgi:ABC-type nitrate/sulfonate/bicarbonate transport system permease component
VTKAVDPLTLPSFTGTVQQLWQDVSTGSLNSDFVATGEPFLIGLAISIVVGSVIGVAMGLSRLGETILTPWVLGFNAVPRIAFIPMTIIAFGLGVTAHSVVVVATAVFPMIINMHAGVRSVDPELLEMSTAFRASRWLNLRRVVIPSTAPFFSSGFRMAIALALIGEVVAEFFSANRGLGYQLNVASQVYNIKQVYAMMIVLAVIGIVLASLARLLERRVERWYGTAR